MNSITAMKLFVLALSILQLGAIASATAAHLPGNHFVKFTSDERGTPMAHVAISMAKLFPNTPANLTGFEIDVGYTNYNTTLFQKLAHDLGNAKGTFESKAGAAVSALFGKEFTLGSDPEMDEDYNRLRSVAHPGEFHQVKANAYFTWGKGHAIKLGTCAAFLSCISGKSCKFYVTINKAPRSRCEVQGGQNCCMSWANYNVKAGFFKVTWTNCWKSGPPDTKSCEGHDNGSGNGGDVCFSNRATGCT